MPAVARPRTKGGSAALVATTYSQHTGGRFTYLYAFSGGTTSLAPGELGYTGKVYVYDVINDSGKAMDATQANTWGNAYSLIAPVGPSGVAFLGDKGKFVPLGKKRISAFAGGGDVDSLASGSAPPNVDPPHREKPASRWCLSAWMMTRSFRSSTS